MLDRRSLLAGLTALPAAGLPIAAMTAADPFTAHHGDGSEDDKDRLMDRWAEIDAQALAGQPTTLAGALGALQMARREFVQFHIEPREGGGSRLDPGDRLILHLIDGAIAVLRQATGGGVA